MENFVKHVDIFFEDVAGGKIEIYNEFSLQHELGIFLRSHIARPNVKVQFERPVDFFGMARRDCVKTEIDIAIFETPSASRSAIEVKFPRNGQYPEQMFKFCQDIAFLEQLVRGGFHCGYFVVAIDDPLFSSGPGQSGIYAYFRGVTPIHGRIIKPTGKRDEAVDVRGSYPVNWHQAGRLKFACIIIGDERVA